MMEPDNEIVETTLTTINGRLPCARCGELVAWTEENGFWHEACLDAEILEDKVHGACEAMARVMTWVWCEGMARDLASGAYGRASFNTDPDTEERGSAVFRAIDLGLLRLDWGR